MLGKLMKYELKATARTFLPLYFILLGVACIHRFLGRENGVFYNLNKIGNFTTVILIALFIAIGVLTLVVTIQRFSKNLLGDEGYLMFTLPTSSRKLILSKIIIGMIWTIASTVISILTFIILVAGKEFIEELSYVLKELKYILQTAQIESLVLAAQMLFSGFLNYTQFILSVYFSLCIGHLPVFQKHRNIIGIITFIFINSLLGMVINFVSTPTYEIMDINMIMLIYNSLNVILIVGFFEGINYILKRQLNLE